MRSSISSSDQRLVTGAWDRTWLLTLGLVLVILGGWEAFWRLRGWTPTVEANRESWILALGKLRPTSTVITGTSRIQGALDPDAWQEATGEAPPIQLAVAGGSPLPVLEHLAADSLFRGLVLADVLPFYYFDVSHDAQTVALDYLKEFRLAQTSPAKRWEAYLRTRLPNHLVFRREELLPAQLVEPLSRGVLPPTPHSYERPDRYFPIIFRQTGFPANAPAVLDTTGFVRLRRVTRPATGPTLDSLMIRTRRAVERIQSRGGKVVLIYFEACGGRREIENQLYPRATYWEPLAHLPDVEAIDSRDHAAMSQLACFDGSHIDREDAPAVTRVIADLVRRPG